METTLFVLALLACPLGMAAMAGIAWLTARARRARTAAAAAPPAADGDNRAATTSAEQAGAT